MILHMSTHKFESHKLEDINKHIDDETFFIFDIDHTLIEPVQIIGSTHWEKYVAKKLVSQGFSQHEAMVRAFHLWRSIQHITAVKIVEEGIFELLQTLEQMKILTLGLTARDGTLSNLTFEQLASVKLDKAFSMIKPCQDLPSIYPCRYSKGAVFCGFNKKDKALELFLDQIDFMPKKIVYIDDQVSHIDELEHFSKAKGIKYVGMKYSASGDHRFDPKIADVQEKHLPKLISDREAREFLET